MPSPEWQNLGVSLFSSNDITYVLSGGTDNRDISLSLGGDPSVQPIIGTLDNLFDDLGTNTLQTGSVDYRCFYVFNDSTDYTLFQCSFYIISEIPKGADIDLGFYVQDDIQQVNLSNTPQNGDVIFTYENLPVTVTYAGSLSDFANATANGITALIPNITVVATAAANSFTLIFSGAKYQPLIKVAVDSTGSGMYVIKLKDGSPVNAITVQTASGTTPPSNVVFSYPTAIEPFNIGDLYPGEGFPVWVRRTVQPGATAVIIDGFTVRLIGQPATAPVGVIPPPYVPPPYEPQVVVGSGGISMGGAAIGPPLPNNRFYIPSGGINMTGWAGVSVTQPDAPCPSFCCLNGVPTLQYSLEVQGLATPTTPPICDCTVLSSCTLQFDYTSCKWYGESGSYYEGINAGAAWVLEHDVITGQWTLSACFMGCGAISAVWTPEQFNCEGTSTAIASGKSVSGQNQTNQTSTGPCVVDSNFLISLYAVTGQEQFEDDRASGPIPDEQFYPVVGNCYCMAYSWMVNISSSTDCLNDDGSPACADCTYLLTRNSLNYWTSPQTNSSNQPIVYLTMEFDVSIDGYWLVTMHNNTSNAQWVCSEDLFNCCGTSSPFVIFNDDCRSTSGGLIGPQNIIYMIPLDCAEPLPTKVIEISGCASYTHGCIPCDQIPYPPQAPNIGDSSFEMVTVSNIVTAPSGSAWTFYGNAGLVHDGAAVLDGVAAPSGSQVGFVEDGGTISQNMRWGAASYALNFLAYQQGAGGLKVMVDDTVVLDTFVPSGSGFQMYTTNNFLVQNGGHTIYFIGVGGTIVFIDEVSGMLSPDMHPQTVSWTGFGGLQPIDPNNPDGGVYAVPGNLFPIYFNLFRNDVPGQALCSGNIGINTHGPGQNAVEGTGGDYSVDPSGVVNYPFSCGFEYNNTGVLILNTATANRTVVFQFVNLDGVTTDSVNPYFKVVIQ